MVRFLLVVGRVVLGVILFAVAVACVASVVHRMQLRRLHALAQTPMQHYVVEDSAYFVLNGASVIDGTGSDERKEQAIVVRDGQIAWIGNSSAMPAQPGAKVVDLHGSTVIPGLVMLHEHPFTTGAGDQLVEQSVAFPLL